MRIGLVLSQQLGSTGSGVFTANLAFGLAELGHAVSILAFGAQPDFHIDPRVRVVDGTPFLSGMQLPGMSDIMPYETRRFSSLSDEESDEYYRALQAAVTAFVRDGFDVLHVNHLWLAASAARSVWSGPACITVHGTDLAQFEKCPRLVDRFGLRDLGQFPLHFPSRRLFERAQAMGLSPPRSEVIPAPFREDIFFAPNGNAPRSGSVCVGKISDEKGLHELARAYALVCERWPGHPLYLVGGGGRASDLTPFFPLSPDEREGAAIALGVLDQASLADLYRQLKILVCPSWSEGFSLVCLEAAASGMKIVMPRFRAVDDQLEQLLPPASLFLFDPLASTREADRTSFALRLAAAWSAAELAAPDPAPVDLGAMGRVAVARTIVERLYRAFSLGGA